MAKRGRKPKPTAQHKRQGTDRPDRHKENPDPGGKIPVEPPESLNEVARQWWWVHAPIVNRMDLGREADASAFEELAVMYSRAKRCDRIIEEEGLIFHHPRTNAPTKRPEVTESRMCWKEYRVGCEIFGLSPAGRARYGTESGSEDDDEVRILGRA